MGKQSRILREAQPTSRQDAEIEAMELALEKDPESFDLDIDSLAEWLRMKLPGHVHGYDPSLPPDGPTDAPPGSEAKVEIMTRRAEQGRALFHKRDRKIDRRPV